jgi:hypothetical protein
MIRMFSALFLMLLAAAPALAQSFAPKSYPECTMLYAKKAASRDGAMLMRQVCKCRFQDQQAAECKDYSQAALDCILANVGAVERDEQAWGVERACRNKHPVK